MPEDRTERTDYLGLLALMRSMPALPFDTQGWGLPYWDVHQIEAALYALAQAPRDGTVPMVAPAAGPTLSLVASGGQIQNGRTYEIAQTFVDEWGRETNAGPVSSQYTGDPLADPVAAGTIDSVVESGTGFEGGLLEIWYTWRDANGGETLPSPSTSSELPYRSGGLKSEVTFSLPSTPAAAGAAGANIYLQHRGGNIVLAYQILVDSADSCTLTGVVANCFQALPPINTTGAVQSIQITGAAAPADAAYIRFYVRETGQAWTAGDRRLKIAGADQWDPGSVVYPLVYHGYLAELAPGYPPTVSQVKAIRPVDLASEVMGTLAAANLPAAAVLETELVKAIGEAVISGLVVSAHAPADMGVGVSSGEALLTAGRFSPAAADLVIPAADPTNPRIDIIVINSSGVPQGPTEDAALKGTPAGSPSAPSTPSGALLLAWVQVEAGATEIAAGKITDKRSPLTTLVAETAARIAADLVIAGNLSSHAADAVLHASKAYTIADVNLACDPSDTADFTITGPGAMLVTQLRIVATSAGTIDYMIELFSDAGRTVLQYQAGEAGTGIAVGTFEDRIPWEWFGTATLYGRITNYSGDALSNVAVGLKHRL